MNEVYQIPPSLTTKGRLKELIPGPKFFLLVLAVLGLIFLKNFILPTTEPVVFVQDELAEQREYLIQQECQNAVFIAEDKWQMGNNTYEYQTKPDIIDELSVCINKQGFVTKRNAASNVIIIVMKPENFVDLIRGYFQGDN